MDDILRELRRPSWWISVLVGGIAVNLISAYIKPWVDRIAGRWSRRRRESNEAKRSAFEARVAQVSIDTEERTSLWFELIEHRVHEVGWLLWAVLLVVQAESAKTAVAVVLYVLATLGTIGAITTSNEAWALDRILSTAERKRRSITHVR